MKKRAKAGDVFSAKLSNGQYMFGRVLLDINTQCIKSKKVDRKVSMLGKRAISYVIEVFDAIQDNEEMPIDPTVLIPGISVDPESFEEDRWNIIGHIEVDPKEVDFQEDYEYYEGEVIFYRGELVISGKLDDDQLYALDSGYFLNSSDLFDAAIVLKGKPELSKYQTDIEKYDKRFSQADLRKRVFQAIGEEPEMDYYHLALKHGFDTTRFFDK